MLLQPESLKISFDRYIVILVTWFYSWPTVVPFGGSSISVSLYQQYVLIGVLLKICISYFLLFHLSASNGITEHV